MVFYISTLSQSQNQKSAPEIPVTIQSLKQELHIRYHQASLKGIHHKTRANYFLERRLLP